MSNAVDIGKIYDSIYSWIASRNLVDPQHVFLEDPNADRPSPPSISFRLLTGPQTLGTTDSHKYNPTEDVDEVSGHRSLTVSIKSYGPKAIQTLINLKESLELFSVQQYLQSQNIAVWNAGNVLNISSELETGIETRGQLDLTLGVSSSQTDDEGAIEHIEITDATITKEDGSVLEETSYTIDKS